jgi:hypothetical protein
MQTGVKITVIAIGDAKRIERTYTTLPPGITIEKAWMTVKLSDRQLDADALFQKAITINSSAAGQITDADSTNGDLAMFFDLVKADSLNAVPGRLYLYDIQVKRTGESKAHTLEMGTITFVRGITDADT